MSYQWHEYPDHNYRRHLRAVQQTTDELYAQECALYAQECRNSRKHLRAVEEPTDAYEQEQWARGATPRYHPWLGLLISLAVCGSFWGLLFACWLVSQR